MSRRFEDVMAASQRRRDELEAQSQAEAAERARHNAEARARIEGNIEAARDAKREQTEREQAARHESDEQQLRGLLRAQLRAGNPSASNEDFERIYPQLRDEYMRRRMMESEAAHRSQYANII
jgi:hypothetical protein